MPVTIDLNTVIVSPESRIWRLFPGENYRLLDDYIEHNAAFLEVPGLRLPQGAVSTDTPELLERYMVSRRLARWIRAGQEGDKPSMNLEDYSGYHWTDSRKAHRTTIIGLYGEAKSGEIVLVPDNLSAHRVLVGEFATSPEQRTRVAIARYGSEPIPARRVRWLGAIYDGDLPRDLVISLRTKNYFTLIPRTYYRDVLDIAYGTYVLPDAFVAKFTTSSQDFTQRNNYDFGGLGVLFEALCQRFDEDNWGLPENATIQDLISGIHIDSDYETSLSIDINSPGIISLASARIVPLFAAAMFLVLSTNATGGESVPPTDVRIVNQATGEDDPCAPEVEERIVKTLNMMSYQQWKVACEMAQRLRDTAGVESPSKLVNEQ